jgi:hypothetical protein
LRETGYNTQKKAFTTQKKNKTHKKISVSFFKIARKSRTDHTKKEQNAQKKNLAHKNNFINITVKSHILRHALKSGCLNLRTVPQLIGTLFFPLLRACHFIRKRGSCYMPLKAKILLFVA